MRVKGTKSIKFTRTLGAVGLVLLGMGFFGTGAMAQMGGVCSNCHTMHNSQNDNTQVFVGVGAGWNAGTLGGGTSNAEQEQLLKTDCVGCHTNTSSQDTIVTIGGSKVPIVYNTTAYPSGASTATTPLAGGNFFNVASNDTYGHNVAGISSADSALTYAPGSEGVNCANGSCHQTLTTIDVSAGGLGPEYKGGCQGCHTRVGHHNPNDPSYRYLGGHGFPGIDYVDGGGVPNTYEDADWEQTKGAADHNFYKRQNSHFDFGIGGFCAGCHSTFHAMGQGAIPYAPIDNGGDDNTDNLITANSTPSNPWLRHPTNVNIPNNGEYAAMFSGPAAYNPAVPVAQNPAGNPNIIDAGDQVMCLSCHRAHGSNQPDALRFNYSTIVAHNAGAAAGTGCFYCHTTKDDP